MVVLIIDCSEIFKHTKNSMREFIFEGNRHISLAIISIGDDKASKAYLKGKIGDCEDICMNCIYKHYDSDVSKEEVAKEINRLNKDDNVHGIIVQLPVPEHIGNDIVNYISADKDVDGFIPSSPFTPCTPKGIMNLLYRENVDFTHDKFVVVGKGKLVGRPIINILKEMGANVTICDSKTKDVKSETLKADVLIVAVGKKGLITKDMIKDGAIVIDAGINVCDGKLYGDVDRECYNLPIKITPVPKGVGLMTRLSLLENTIISYKNREHVKNE